MSRVVVTELTVNEALAIGTANATLTSFDNASADIDDLNVRVEGLDARNFTANDVVEDMNSGNRHYSTDGSVSVTTGSAAIVTISAADVKVGTWTFDTSDNTEFIIYCTFEWDELSPTSSGYNFQLAYSVNGAPTWNLITATKRQTNSGTTTSVQTGSIGIRHRFVTSVDTSNLEFALFAWLTTTGAGQAVAVRNVTMFGRLIRV